MAEASDITTQLISGSYFILSQDNFVGNAIGRGPFSGTTLRGEVDRLLGLPTDQGEGRVYGDRTVSTTGESRPLVTSPRWSHHAPPLLPCPLRLRPTPNLIQSPSHNINYVKYNYRTVIPRYTAYLAWIYRA